MDVLITAEPNEGVVTLAGSLTTYLIASDKADLIEKLKTSILSNLQALAKLGNSLGNQGEIF